VLLLQYSFAGSRLLFPAANPANYGAGYHHKRPVFHHLTKRHTLLHLMKFLRRQFRAVTVWMELRRFSPERFFNVRRVAVGARPE
jgi:hypothetical protein